MGAWTLFLSFVALLLRVAKPDLLACCNHATSDQNCHSVCTALSCLTHKARGVAESRALYGPIDEVFTESSDLRLNSNQFQNMTRTCPSSYHQLWACINKTTTSPTAIGEMPPTEVTQVTTVANYYCCDRALEGECRDSCRKELLEEDQIAAIERVIEVCGPPPTGPMWECFIAPPTDPPTLKPANVDWARIQCCNHARASDCRDSCVHLYSGIESSLSWQTLQLDCIHRPSEASLITCLNDVSFPCKLGCTGLHFCSNFNNRPTQSFRQCTTSADYIAKNDYYTWSNYRRINHPLATVIIKDVQSCHPELWKALACIIHVQPCHPVTHATQICREDCLRLLRDCNNSTYSTTAICDIITPASSNDNCLSLSEYTKPSRTTDYQVSLVTNPCDPNPCKNGFICSINHLCRPSDRACSHYVCEAGCSVGESPSLLYPHGSRIKVPVDLLSTQDECYGFFNCTTPSSGLSETQNVPGTSPLPPPIHCEEQLHCFKDDRIYPHLAHFLPDDCNMCTCYYGRIKCTDLLCQSTEMGPSTYLNCDCPRVHEPVCTSDGRTLPNACTAECLGYKKDEYKIGDCNTFDPCRGHSCDVESRCMPNRRVCLQGNDRECVQHTCEPLLQPCNSLPNPVCDASNSQHSTLCNFLRTQEEFGYHGYCREGCSRVNARPVCGVNGETFETSCHAESVHIAVDYHGPCKAVPGSGSSGSCSDVICPSLSHSECSGVKSWSSCCPKCGGHITILMDEGSLELNSIALGQATVSSIDIIGRLRHYVTSLQCDLYGFLAPDGSLSVLILPVINASAQVVIEACNQEAVKLATLINNRTPMLASDPFLSHLIAARAQVSYFQSPDQTQDNIGGVSGSKSAKQIVGLFVISISLVLASLASF